MKVVWDCILVDAISMITLIVCHIINFYNKTLLRLAYKSPEVPGLQFIVFMMWTYVPTKSLNTFRKLILEMDVSEVAPVIMRVEEE
jgi:hypothetical protein